MDQQTVEGFVRVGGGSLEIVVLDSRRLAGGGDRHGGRRSGVAERKIVQARRSVVPDHFGHIAVAGKTQVACADIDLTASTDDPEIAQASAPIPVHEILLGVSGIVRSEREGGGEYMGRVPQNSDSQRKQSAFHSNVPRDETALTAIQS